MKGKSVDEVAAARIRKAAREGRIGIAPRDKIGEHRQQVARILRDIGFHRGDKFNTVRCLKEAAALCDMTGYSVKTIADRSDPELREMMAKVGLLPSRTEGGRALS